MIRFTHVSKQYPRGGPALDDVSFHLNKGEFAFLTGPSGAGKSTILKLIYVGERPTHGEVRVAGQSSAVMTRSQVPALRRRIGVVFQEFRLLEDRTAEQNVAFALEVIGTPRSQIGPKVARVLTQVGLAAKATSLPHELSGGEQQRVAIARAVAKRPDVLLCDEPTGALDFETGVKVLEVLAHANRELGTTTVVITHNAAIAGMADRVIRMRSGGIVGIERNAQRRPPAELSW